MNIKHYFKRNENSGLCLCNLPENHPAHTDLSNPKGEWVDDETTPEGIQKWVSNPTEPTYPQFLSEERDTDALQATPDRTKTEALAGKPQSWYYEIDKFTFEEDLTLEAKVKLIKLVATQAKLEAIKELDKLYEFISRGGREIPEVFKYYYQRIKELKEIV